MLNFNNVDNAEFSELKQTIQKSVEKSDLDRYYLFSTDKMIKAKLFILCYRFLLNAWNLTLESGLKTELKAEIDLVEDTYKNINYYMNYLDTGRRYGKHIIVEKLFYEVNKQEVTDLIDVFAILTERVNIISMSRFKGVIMEGKSGDEFNKIIRGDSERRSFDEPLSEEEPLPDAVSEESIPSEPVEPVEQVEEEPVNDEETDVEASEEETEDTEEEDVPEDDYSEENEEDAEE